MTAFNHGVTISEDTSGVRSIQTNNTSRFGIVGTAPSSQAAVAASLIVNPTYGVANNNGFTITADTAGKNGNAITLEMVNAGASQSLAVVVTNNAIKVTLATDGSSVITSTAEDVITAINGDTDASALVTAADYLTSDGTGVVTALASVNLTGGEDEPFPLDTPVLITSNDRVLLNKLGDTGNLKESLTQLFNVTGCAGVVVRVSDDPTPATEQANVAGSSANRTGFYAMLNAEAQTGVKPKWLFAPYYTQYVAVANAGLAVAEKLLATILIDCDEAATEASAITYSQNFGGGRNPVLHPWDKVTESDGSIVNRPPSQITAGVCILNDKERGFWWSPSNRSYPIAVGQVRDIDFTLGDADSLANILNENFIMTKVKLSTGYVLWGNRTPSSNSKYSLLSTRRITDAIIESIQAAHIWAVDQNITAEYFKSVIESVRQYLRELETQGAIAGGDCYADGELNTTANLANGKVYFNFEFTPVTPAEHITFTYQITDAYFSEVLSGN